MISSASKVCLIKILDGMSDVLAASVQADLVQGLEEYFNGEVSKDKTIFNGISRNSRVKFQ